MDSLYKLLPSCVQNFNTNIDFVGQQKAERIFQVVLTVHGVLGFIAGYLTQQISVTMYCIGFGFLLSCLIVLPPWGIYRRNPLNWQPNVPSDKAKNGSEKSTTTSGKTNSKKNR